MQNSMVMLTFPVIDYKYPFQANLGSEIESCQFKLKFGTSTNSNMQNSMVVFTFYVNLVQKNENYQFQLKFDT